MRLVIHHHINILVWFEHLNWSDSLENIVCNWMRATGDFHFKTYTLLSDQLVQPIIMTNATQRVPKGRNYPTQNCEVLLGGGKMCFLGVNRLCPF